MSYRYHHRVHFEVSPGVAACREPAPRRLPSGLEWEKTPTFRQCFSCLKALGQKPPTPLEYIDFVFEGSPGPEGPRFVEAITPEGASMCAGDWVARPDGRWVLRVFPEAFRK